MGIYFQACLVPDSYTTVHRKSAWSLQTQSTEFTVIPVLPPRVVGPEKQLGAKLAEWCQVHTRHLEHTLHWKAGNDWRKPIHLLNE